MDAQMWQQVIRGAFLISWFVGVTAVVVATIAIRDALALLVSNNREMRETREGLARLEAFIPILQAREQELGEVLAMTRAKAKVLEDLVKAADHEIVDA